MKTLQARITWNTEDQGCVEKPFSGIQPSFAVAGDLIVSRIERSDGMKEMERGNTYDVLIRLPYGEMYQQHLFPGMEVKLQVGARVIATGTVDRVL